LIYYLFSYNSKLPGVNNKVIEKIYSLDRIGLNIKGIILYNEKNVDLSYLPERLFEKHFYIPKPNTSRLLKTRFFSFLNSAIQNSRSTKEVYDRFLADKKVDFLILRYGTADNSIKWLIKKLKGKVIFESNTNELDQLKLRFKGLLKTPSWITYDYLSEKYLGASVLKKTAAVVCVTHELADYQKKRIGNVKGPEVVTISNGVNVDLLPLAPAVSEPVSYNLLMVCGGDVEWHGLDKIAPFVKGSKFKLFVVGDVSKRFQNENITYTGILAPDQITELIRVNSICCGIGSLAIERVGLKEAAPLKVREYIARGLPVIYSYDDTDIDNAPVFRDSYCIKLESEIDKVDLIIIEKRLKKVLAIKNYNLHIREFALKHLDVNSKALQYKQLIEKLSMN
jgi:hypothetical protein